MENLNSVMEKLLTYIQNAESFVLAETPDYIRQLLEYAYFSEMMDVVVLAVLFCIALFVAGWFVSAVKKKENEEYLAGAVFASIITITTLIAIPFQYRDVYKIKHTPKVYIVEQVKRMMK